MQQLFQKLYVLQSHQIRKNTNFDSFLFVWKNWDYYFTEKNSKNSEVLENVIFTTQFVKEKFIDRDYDNTSNFLQYA
jgi:hypothetical protein